MQWIAEFFDDKEYQFYLHHRLERIEANNCKEAMAKAVLLAKEFDVTGLMEGAEVAQLSRHFAGNDTPQPVFDFMNGWITDCDVIDQAIRWEDLRLDRITGSLLN